MPKSLRGTAARTAPAFLMGGGAMAEAVLGKDWSATPLGPIQNWPQSLRTTVSLCLASNFPISMAWGPQRVQIYNDGYWKICKAKHPGSMGQDFKECWGSAWPQIGEAFEKAQAGETSYIENERMFLDRDGYLEETFFTFSFSPIRDEKGEVGGLFHPVTETTATMLSERRTRALRDLTAVATKAKSVEECCTAAAEVLGQHAFDLPFVLIYLVDEEGRFARLTASAGFGPATHAGQTLANLQMESGPEQWPLREVYESRKTELLREIRGQIGSEQCGPYPGLPQGAMVIPIARGGTEQAGAILVAGVSARLPLDETYRIFYDLLGSHLASALANVRAREEEQRKAKALAEIDRAKTEFFSNVSHEFRTPLTLILGPLDDLLAQSTLDPVMARNELQLVQRNAGRLLKLVNTLLDFSRIEAGRVEAVFEATDLSKLTTDLSSAFRSATERAGLKLVVDCAPLDKPVYVDREMWEKIVLNLISNALKFTFEGEVEVSLRVADEFALLTVRDTGIGIEENELPRVFERFHRILGARARTHEGTGIGLALVQELARLHGGAVWVDSKFGRGTTFTVSIPADMRNAPREGMASKRHLESTAVGRRAFVDEAMRWVHAEASSAEVEGQVEGAREQCSKAIPEGSTRGPGNRVSGRILLADDNADMREYVRGLLAGTYAVATVGDGEEALEVARGGEVDLVLTDVMMPVMDGFELLRELRSDARTNALPVILLSARAGEESRVEGLDAGADDYLVKPFTARELLARVDSHLRMAKIRREAAALQESEMLFRSMSDSAPILMWTCGLDQRGDYFNAGWLQFTGRTTAEEAGRGWVESVHANDREFFLSTFQTAFAAKLPFQLECRLRRHDGQYRWVLGIGAPRQWKNGELLGYTVSCVDINDRKEAEDEVHLLNEHLELRVAERTTQLATINKDLEAFTASVAHDLRSPIFAVDGYCMLLLEKYGDQLPSEAQHYVERTRESAKRMNRLVEDLLNLSRIGNRELNLRQTGLNELLEQVRAEITGRREERSIEWQISDLPTVQCDPGLLRQVFINLLDNAVKYTRGREQARIEVGTTQNCGERVIFVRDNGAGFDMQHASKLFGAFERLHRQEEFEGTGIGLTTVQRIVQKHGGRIWAEAEIGRGASFFFTLGATEEAESASPAAAEVLEV